jgi:hypothetical protein
MRHETVQGNNTDDNNSSSNSNLVAVGNDAVSALCHSDHQNDISDITEMSSPHDDQVVKKTDVEPMPVLPKISEDGQDPDSSTVAANSTIENEHSASHNPNLNLPLKQCFECQRSKDQNCFTASQWKKTKGTGRCIGCVSLCAQWLSSGISPSTLQAKLCCSCQQQKKHAEFTPNQWRRPVGTGRCRDCVARGPL